MENKEKTERIDFNDSIHQRIRTWLAEHGDEKAMRYPDTQIAAILDYDYQTFAKQTNSTARTITATDLLHFADKLGCSVDYLLGREIIFQTKELKVIDMVKQLMIHIAKNPNIGIFINNKLNPYNEPTTVITIPGYDALNQFVYSFNEIKHAFNVITDINLRIKLIDSAQEQAQQVADDLVIQKAKYSGVVDDNPFE